MTWYAYTKASNRMVYKRGKGKMVPFDNTLPLRLSSYLGPLRLLDKNIFGVFEIEKDKDGVGSEVTRALWRYAEPHVEGEPSPDLWYKVNLERMPLAFGTIRAFIRGYSNELVEMEAYDWDEKNRSYICTSPWSKGRQILSRTESGFKHWLEPAFPVIVPAVCAFPIPPHPAVSLASKEVAAA